MSSAIAILAALCGLAWTAGAAIAADFTWTGTARMPTWSEGTNWSGNASPGGAVGTVEFPVLGGASCMASPPAATSSTCYTSTNDSSVTAAGITVDDGVGYTIAGNPILLGAGGLTTTTAAGDQAPADGGAATLSLNAPLVLEAPQTWSITGGPTAPQIEIGGMVSSPGTVPVTIDLSQPSNLAFANANVGPVTVTGDGNPQDGDVQLGYFDRTGALTAGSLNATDEQPVGFTDGAGVFALDGTIGPTSMASGIVQIGEPNQAGTLGVSGTVSINAQSELLEYVDGPGTAAGTDYSQLRAANANLAGSALALADGERAGSTACALLHVGDVDTLVKTTTPMSGAFAGVPDGATVSVRCFGSGGAAPTVAIQYAGTSVTATVLTAGTPAAASTTTVAVSPASPVTNQPVTLSATVAPTGAGVPVGTVEFDAAVGGASAPIAGCAVQPVAASGGGYTASCATSFTGSGGPASVSAAFTAGDGSTAASSSSSAVALSVGPAPTTTSVAIAPATVGLDQTTTYTATVTPSQPGGALPTGPVTFFVNGQPLGAAGGSAGCAALPLATGASSSAVACQESFASGAGTQALAVTATYAGDGNFAGSTSAPQTVTVVGPPGPPTPPAGTAAPGIGRATFGRANASATIADVVVACKGSAGETCRVTLSLTTRERTERGKVVSASAAAAKPAQRTVAVGTRTITLAAGLGEIVHVKLNAAGRRALVRLHRLPVKLAATQRTSRGTSPPTVRRIAFGAAPAKV